MPTDAFKNISNTLIRSVGQINDRIEDLSASQLEAAFLSGKIAGLAKQALQIAVQEKYDEAILTMLRNGVKLIINGIRIIGSAQEDDDTTLAEGVALISRGTVIFYRVAQEPETYNHSSYH